MEKITLKKTQSIEKFINWIECFKGEISDNNLTLEFDFNNSKFVSKAYTQDKSLVRYSEITFEESGMEVVGDATVNGRVFFATIVLDKFIATLKIFESSKDFSMTVEYDLMDVKGTQRLCVTNIAFTSKQLNMNFAGASLASTELIPLEDSTFFDRIWIAPDAVSVKVSADLIKNIICISDILTSVQKTKNYMQFYSAVEDGKRVIKVREPKQNIYDYVLGEAEGEFADRDFSVAIYRERFLAGVKNVLEDSVFSFSTQSEKTMNRVLINAVSNDTKTIIARVNMQD